MDKVPQRILKLGIPKRFPRGVYVFQAEDEAVKFFYVRTGEVRVFKVDERGRELEVTRLAAGEFLGEAVALIGGRFPFFAQTAKDSDLIVFETGPVGRAVESDPSVARFFIELLARKCLILSGRLESLGLRTVRQRLIQYLLADCPGGLRCVVELKIKKGELARLLGTINETLSRNLRQMQEENLIEVRGAKIVIKDCARLREEISA